jgi:hypothetical protein
MYEVEVYPTRVTAHLSQVLAGLLELRRAGRVRIGLSEGPVPAELRDVRDVMRLDVTANGELRRVCFDVSDNRRIDPMVAEVVDVYLKRTFRFANDGEHRAFGARILPYGLNYGCVSVDGGEQRRLAEAMAAAVGSANGTEWRRWLASARERMRRAGLLRGGGASSPLDFPAFECAASTPADGRVIFLTRVWHPADVPECDADAVVGLNETRAQIIRQLRKELGDRFIGGFEASVLARKRYGDCVYRGTTRKRDYVALMQRCLVGVASDGLHDSTGWKLPEYLAAARCVVSQPVAGELPRPLIPGEHYLPYQSPEECVAACLRLLSNPDLASAMREANEAYYASSIAPPTLVGGHLDRAFWSDAA